MTTNPPTHKKGELSPRAQYLIERHAVIFFIWALLVFLNWIKTAPTLLRGELQGNDDYMRLVQIRDWLGGQNWTDLHQYRLNPVDPIVMHWSRISDVLIGVPIKFLTPIVGTSTAEVIVMAAYPSLMLLAFMYLVVGLTMKLTDNMRAPMAASFMAALSYGALAQFGMGRIDHHSLQIVMALACLYLIIISAQKPMYMLIAGALCGLGLYVGIESAPYIAAACVSTVLVWVFSENNAEKRLRWFGLAMASSALISLLISAPPSRWFLPTCDALSIVYTQLTLMISLVLWGLSFASEKIKTPIARLALAGGLASGALALTIVLFPHCLKGPYAQLDPRLTDIWLSNVSEAERFFGYWSGHIVNGTSMIILPVFTCFGYWLFHKQSGKALMLAPRSTVIFMVMALLAGLLQTRLMAFAASFSIPFAAYLLVSTLSWSEKFKTSLIKNMARMGFLILLAPITIPLLLSPFEKETKTPSEPKDKLALNCLSQPILTQLNALPTGIALTQIDMGAAILAHTHLSVTSAPYHRNTSGILAALDAFMGDSDTAKQAARQSNANYIVTCQDNNETKLYTSNAPNGFMANLAAGQVPDWLKKIDIGTEGGLLVYAIK